MSARPILISHPLCPYVQRAAIVLKEKGAAFERRNIDLADKPDWFLALSPLGRTPVLLVDGEAVFESAVICEFLDETLAPRLHPVDPLERARHRAWMELGSSLLNAIGSFYNANDEAALAERAGDLRARFGRIESMLGAGPYFAGTHFSVVDAVYGPVFRYFDAFEGFGVVADLGFFDGLPKVGAWRTRLASRPSVRDAVCPDYPQRLRAFLRRRPSALARRLAAAESCPAGVRTAAPRLSAPPPRWAPAPR